MFISLGEFYSEKNIFEMWYYALMDVTNADSPIVVYYIWPLAVLVVLAALLNFVTLFAFKYRPFQMKACGINVGIQLGLSLILFYLGYSIAGDVECEWHLHIAPIMPLLGAVLDFFAYRAISDDEALIRSLNRLR